MLMFCWPQLTTGFRLPAFALHPHEALQQSQYRDAQPLVPLAIGGGCITVPPDPVVPALPVVPPRPAAPVLPAVPVVPPRPLVPALPVVPPRPVVPPVPPERVKATS